MKMPASKRQTNLSHITKVVAQLDVLLTQCSITDESIKIFRIV